MYLREAVNRFRALIGAVTKLGLCICKFDSEKVSASPATNLTARHCCHATAAKVACSLYEVHEDT